MKEYKEDIKNSIEAMKNDGVILGPTDTVWGLAASVLSKTGFQKVNIIKQRPVNKRFILLVDSYEKLISYAKQISPKLIAYAQMAEEPVSLVFKANNKIPEYAVAEDGTICMRVCSNKLIKEIINGLGAPILSTSANLKGEETPGSFKDINQALISQVDYSCQSGRTDEESTTSKIIKMDENEELVFLR